MVAAPWPPRCPHPRFKPGAGSSPLPPSGRGDGCCGRGRFGRGEGGGGCGAGTAHRVDGAVGVNESGSTTLTKMIRSAEECEAAMGWTDEVVLVELKAISGLERVHLAQAINYLETFGLEVGLLLNFGAAKLEFRRVGVVG